MITINEKKRETEEQSLMIDLQSNLDGLKKVRFSKDKMGVYLMYY